MVRIASVNVNGLNNKSKRQNIFRWLDKKRFDIVLIQETHCSNTETENVWKKEWCGDSTWNHGTNLSKGVSVLFNKFHDFTINSITNFENGRITSIKLSYNSLNIQIVNLYAPNNAADRRLFNSNIASILDDDYIHILGGDFNCSQNNLIDRDPKQNNKDKGFKELEDIKVQYNLEDIYRQRYPKRITFTFSRGNLRSRIDYFLTSTLLDGYIKDASVISLSVITMLSCCI